MLLFGIAFLLPSVVLTQTNISGNIVNNMTLTAANSPYIATGSINVNDGVTLTVESGVEMRFNNGTYLQVFGTMVANSATFTANQSATPGAWQGIYVSYENSASVGDVTLNNCIVEYASSLFVRKGTLNLNNNTVVKDFNSYGINVYTAGTLNIENTTVQNCTYPLYFNGPGGNGKWNLGSGVVFTGNTNDYAFINFRDVTSVFHLPDPGIPYFYDSELRVTETGTLILDPGVRLLGSTGAYITVYGKIKALGTVAEPIEFNRHASYSHWAGFNFFDQAVDTACIFTHCTISGANYMNSNHRPYEIPYVALEITKSSPVFSNCEFSGNRYNLVLTDRSYPVFTDCNFMESSLANGLTMNINIDMNAEPVFTNCTLAFNSGEAKSIGIMPSTVYGDSHMKKLSFAGIDNITYTLEGNVDILDTASLVIDPGVVIKCRDLNHYIRTYGALTGIGTESEPIVFTHINDDNYGNPADTRNDGTTSISSSSSGRLIIASEVTSTLDHWKILYAGLNSSNYAVYLYNGNVLSNSEVKYTYRAVLFDGNAQLLNNSFDYIAYYPFSRRMNEGLPVMIGNTINNSGHLGIYVYDFLNGSYSIGGLDIGGNTNVAYILDKDTPIPAAANVTIEPGTVFKFSNGSSKLSVSGGLIAAGKKTNKIIFTSLYDNSVSGNTNYNSGADPTGYKWYGIEFYNSSNDDLNTLKNCEVRYVNNSIRMTDCKVVLDSMLLNFSGNYALSIFGSANPVVTNCAFNNLASAPIYMDMFAEPVFSENTIANVGQIGIWIRGQALSGTIPQRNFAGYNNITYLIGETITVNGELTIPAGTVFKGSGSAYFDIYGKLNITGTEENPVIFTTLQDDAFGNPGDTELNGQAGISKQGNRIVIRDQADDASTINHLISRYSLDYAIHMASASPIIKNCTFYNTYRCGLYLVGTAAPTVDSCVFDEMDYAIITSLLTYPGSHAGNIITGRTARAMKIIDDETLTQDYTLTRQSFAGIENIPYLFDRFNVGTSAVLTIEPGVVLKFRQSGYMNVRNGLIAEGGNTPDSTIVFTSDRDDFYGGDTYADGDASLPNTYWWWGVYFLQESIDASCRLNNVIFKNGSRYYTNGANITNRGAVSIDNASPSIRNCLFEKNHRAIIVRNTSLPLISNCDFVETDPTYGYAVWNETGTVTVVAENCWWNDASGPYHPTLNPAGLGERVSDNVDFDPWVSQTAKPIMGDVSLNGEVMPFDASLVLQHAVGNIVLSAKQAAVADVSGDGSISGYDASLILQYTIGLITNFEGTKKKAGFGPEDVTITVPASITVREGEDLELSLALSTPEMVKSLDLAFSTDASHLRFKGVKSDRLPVGLLVASGYNESSGVVKVAVTSAYDLDLNMDELVLVFELKDASVPSSVVELSGLVANEHASEDAAVSTLVESGGDALGILSETASNSIMVYRTGEQVVADINLASAQSRLHIELFDLAGRSLYQAEIGNVESGQHRFHILPGTGDALSSLNFILVTVRGDDFTETRKVVLP